MHLFEGFGGFHLRILPEKVQYSYTLAFLPVFECQRFARTTQTGSKIKRFRLFLQKNRPQVGPLVTPGQTHPAGGGGRNRHPEWEGGVAHHKLKLRYGVDKITEDKNYSRK